MYAWKCGRNTLYNYLCFKAVLKNKHTSDNICNIKCWFASCSFIHVGVCLKCVYHSQTLEDTRVFASFLMIRILCPIVFVFYDIKMYSTDDLTLLTRTFFVFVGEILPFSI